MLGIGLGLNKRNYIKSLISLAKKSDAKLLLYPNKQGAKNSPLTTVLTDLANTVSKNLFDGVWNVGMTLDSQTGLTGTNALRNTTNFIDVLDALNYTTSGCTRMALCFYDASKTYIGFAPNPTFTTPSNTRYIRFSVNNTVTFTQTQLELGSTATAYEPYKLNNATLVNLQGTTADGYENTPFISDMGNNVRFKNEILNNEGNMIDSNADNMADGWNYSNVTPISCVGNEAVFLPTVQYSYIRKITEVRNQNVNDVLYFCAYVKSDKSTTRMLIARGTSQFVNKTHTGGGTYEFLSTQATLLDKTTSYIYIESTSSSAWTNISVKQAHLFNLTTMFPDSNNRPTQTQMDRLVQQALNIYGYINDVNIKLLWQTGLVADGTDTYGTIVDNSSLDFVGTQDFAFTGVFVTPSVLQAGYLIAKNLDTTPQYGLVIQADGSFGSIGDFSFLSSAGTIKTNASVSFKIIRKTGTLKAYVNNTLIYNQSNTASLTSKLFIRLFARSNHSTGTAHTAYGKMTLLQLTAHGANVTEESLQKFTDTAHKPYMATNNAFSAV